MQAVAAVVGRLLAAGANPTAVRADGKKAGELAAPHSRLQRQLLAAEAMWSGAELITRAVLVHAVAMGRAVRVQELLAAGTHVDSVDEHGTGALHAACLRNDSAIVGILLQADASPDLPAAEAVRSK